MMRPVVVDASVVIDDLFGEGDPPEVARLIGAVTSRGGVAPEHFKLEVANVMATRVRTGQINPAAARVLLSDIDALVLRYDEQTGAHAWTSTLDLAHRHRLTIYDAAYLELAIRLGAELATFDNPLRKAAQSENVALV